VHHGNGTQEMFWNEPNVLFVSAHQWPLYPGTGRAQDIGGPDALGQTVNVPLPPGATGDVTHRGLEEIVSPVADAFSPDWVLVSCGFDAHRDDPVGGLSLSGGDFARMARYVRSLTPLPGRLVLFLEGGYSAHGLRASTSATLAALLDLDVPMESPTKGGPGMASLEQVVRARAKALDNPDRRDPD
jgi:acetoin utilization deacetylase AcuC-like enzyme